MHRGAGTPPWAPPWPAASLQPGGQLLNATDDRKAVQAAGDQGVQARPGGSLLAALPGAERGAPRPKLPVDVTPLSLSK